MPMAACIVLHGRILLPAQQVDQRLRKRGQMVKQLAIVHLGEPIGLGRVFFRSLAPAVEDLVFVSL
jgi:hypothetical protein